MTCAKPGADLMPVRDLPPPVRGEIREILRGIIQAQHDLARCKTAHQLNSGDLMKAFVSLADTRWHLERCINQRRAHVDSPSLILPDE